MSICESVEKNEENEGREVGASQRKNEEEEDVRSLYCQKVAKACLVDGIKGNFGYLKPKLAIVYSF